MTVMSATVLAAVMLLVAIVGGYVAKWLRIPRIVAYILGGVGLKYVLCGDSPESARALVASLDFIPELALGLILFIMGGVFEASRLKATRGASGRISAFEILLTAFVTGVACTAAAWSLPGMTVSLSLTVGLVLGAVAIATAPAATWFVLREYDAKGPTSDHLLLLTGLNNLASIVAFHSVLIFCVMVGWMDPATGGQGAWWLELLFVSVGSLVFGALLGVVLSLLHSRLPLREMLLLFFAVLFLLPLADQGLRHVFGVSFNPMVTSLAMGAAFVNIARDPGYFERTLEFWSMPILALFFVLAGYNLHLEELPHLGVLGVVYLAARSAGKVAGVWKGVRLTGEGTKVRPMAGMGLLCQAGVAIWLGESLVRHWDHPVALKINTVILASVALYELAGPLLVKRTAIRAGEVKAVTLLRPGLLRPTWISPAPGLRNLVREYSGKKLRGGTIGAPLTAKHLMRTNVHFLPAEANFDDVLSFIERSRFHDFPVVDKNGVYLGVVHFKKIRDHLYNPASANLVTAANLADKDTPVVTPETELDELLQLFHKHGLGELAVVENSATNRLIGLVEQRDLVRHLRPSSK